MRLFVPPGQYCALQHPQPLSSRQALDEFVGKSYSIITPADGANGNTAHVEGSETCPLVGNEGYLEVRAVPLDSDAANNG